DVIGKTEPILVLAPIVNHLFDSRRYGIVVPGVEGLAREFYSFRTHHQRDGIADRERAGIPREDGRQAGDLDSTRRSGHRFNSAGHLVGLTDKGRYKRRYR